MEETVSFLREHRIAPLRLAHLYEGKSGWTFLPFLVVANKNDDHTMEENVEIFRSLLEDDWPLVSISAKAGRNFDLLKQTLFNTLEIIRVYTKAPSKEQDLSSPFVLKKGAKVEDLASKIHKDFLEKLKYARIWGKHVYDGQMALREHVLHDGDVVEIHL